MLLQQGISGFFDSQDFILPMIDFKDFKKNCYSMFCKELKIIEICNPDYTNYYYFYGSYFNQYIYILVNKYYKIAAITHNISGEKLFIDIANISELFFDYDFIDSDILNSSLRNFKHNFSKAELTQIKYHNPSSIGNIIFNEWD